MLKHLQKRLLTTRWRQKQRVERKEVGCVRYLHQLEKVQLSDTGLVHQEVALEVQQVYVGLALVGPLHGAENKRPHHQVKYDPGQQGQEGGAPHFLPL